MRAQAALSILAALAVALSGCASDEPGTKPLDTEDPQTGSTDGGNETADGNTTTDPDDDATAPNTPPTAEISASTVNGTAPLNVTFTLDGSDADGDDLTWTFTVGNVTEEGTALPASVDVTLEAGNHTATLTVDDGGNQTVASVVVVVEAGADLLVMEFSGTIIAPDPTSYTHTNCLQGFLTQPDGAPGSKWFDLPPETWGGTYAIDAEGIEVRFADYDTAEVYETGTSGTVPADANVVEACGMTAVDTDFTIRIEYTA